MNEISAKKKFIMRVSIGIIVFIILILWSLNLKNVWNNNRGDNQTKAEWLSLKSDLEKTLAEARSKLDKIKEDKARAEKKAGDAFLAGLIENADRIASSSALTATSSPEMATSSPLQQKATSSQAVNCPEYIDCMPTIGGTKPCQVPLGCEGITLIAY